MPEKAITRFPALVTSLSKAWFHFCLTVPVVGPLRLWISSLPEDASFRFADIGYASPAIRLKGVAYVCRTTAAPTG